MKPSKTDIGFIILLGIVLTGLILIFPLYLGPLTLQNEIEQSVYCNTYKPLDCISSGKVISFTRDSVFCFCAAENKQRLPYSLIREQN